MIRLLAAALPIALLAQPARAADYVVIRHEVTAERPLAQVWARIGDYCAIRDWLHVTCRIDAGDGAIGTVRRINDTTVEAMVGRSATSYTYWQSEGAMAVAGYHGTLAAEAVGARRTRLVYTVFYDQARLASDAERASQRARLETRFVAPLAEMKTMAEAR